MRAKRAALWKGMVRKTLSKSSAGSSSRVKVEIIAVEVILTDVGMGVLVRTILEGEKGIEYFRW